MTAHSSARRHAVVLGAVYAVRNRSQMTVTKPVGSYNGGWTTWGWRSCRTTWVVWPSWGPFSLNTNLKLTDSLHTILEDMARTIPAGPIRALDPPCRGGRTVPPPGCAAPSRSVAGRSSPQSYPWPAICTLPRPCGHRLGSSRAQRPPPPVSNNMVALRDGRRFV